MKPRIRTLFLSSIAALVLAFSSGTYALTTQGMGGEQQIPAHAAPEVEKSAEDSTAEVETIDAGVRDKSVADGLYMSGKYTYGFIGSNASITLDRIDNDSYSKTTKTLRLSLWATTYEPVRGAGITGYKLANFSSLTGLAPRTYYHDVSRTGSYLTPPDGAYWIVLVLGEYNPAGCPTNSDGYCLVDSISSFSQVRWGGVAPTFNYTDMWWTPSESGWGVSIVQHASNVVFAAWFTYDEAGKPKWYVSPNCELIGDACFGTLYETTGSPFSGTFDPNAVTVRTVGTLSLSFSSYGAASMKYNVGAVTRTKTINRQSF